MLDEVALSGTLQLMGTMLADADSLRTFSGGAPINTDDHPVVLFGAPAYAYDDSEPAHQRLLVLLDELDVDVGALLGSALADDANGPKEAIGAYLRARDLFLRARALDASGQTTEAIDTCIESVRASHEFAPAYLTLLAEASDHAQRDRALANRILDALIREVPERPEAVDLARRLR
jgi:spermidine synthase